MADRVDRLLNSIEVRHRIGDIRWDTLNRWIRLGKFPAPQKIGSRNWWRESVVLEWMDGRPTAQVFVRVPSQGTAHAPVL